MRGATAYRSDIDGLRAIAVLAVVFYHLDVGLVRGGFVGVDIFFVISGYLITEVICKASRAGTFSIVGFYDRRFRRILPAMLAMFAFTLVAGYVLLFPSDYRNLGEQVAYAATGIANLYFLWNTGYFAPAAEMQPMLHMWSLAVEEQFYLLWPLALAGLLKMAGPNNRTLPLAAIGIIILSSLAVSTYLVMTDAKQAFYLPHSRAWELALGALIVFLPPIEDSRWAELAGVVGLGLIVAAILLLNKHMPFPGPGALLPCIGTALLVWPKTTETLASRVLSTKGAVFVGLISYSLYLWHWPLIVFFKVYANDADPSSAAAVILFAIAFAVAYLSWRYVESPFRRPGSRVPARTVVAGLTAVTAAAALGTSVLAFEGAPWRLTPDEQRIASFLDYSRPAAKDACRSGPEDPAEGAPCARREGQRRVLLMGDSHATHFAAALTDAFPDVQFTLITASGCRPVVNTKGSATCVSRISDAYAKKVPATRFDAIILSARWRNGQSANVRESVAYLSRFTPRIVVFGQTIEYRRNLPAILIRDALPRQSASPSEWTKYEESKKVDTYLREQLRTSKAEYYSVIDVICPDKQCRTTTAEGVPMTFDRAHLTSEAAIYVIERFKQQGLRF